MTASDTQHVESASKGHGGRTTVNWVLAILAVPAAIAVVGFSYAQVMGSAGCTNQTCSGVGPSETVFGAITYGVPAVAVLAVLASFVTARRNWGIVVPMIVWILVIIAAVVLVVTF